MVIATQYAQNYLAPKKNPRTRGDFFSLLKLRLHYVLLVPQ